MNEQLLRQLEDMGLSEKEAKVYIASLMLGPATVQQIANQADIKRVTTYVILESLGGLGLVGQANHGKKTYFTAEPPVSLQRLLDKKQQELVDQKEAFKSILPDLKSLTSIPPETPTVKYYDTIEGLRSAISTLLLSVDLDTIDYIYGFSDVDKVQKLFPEIAKSQGNPVRIKIGKQSRLIYTSERGEIYRDSDKDAYRESRHVSSDKYPINGDLTLLGDHIVMLSLDGDKPFGVTIKSAPLTSAVRAMFELAWIAAAKK